MPMPYTLTRGPILTLVENALNADRTTRLAVLADLRAGLPLDQIVAGHVPATAALMVPQGAPDVRLRTDWIGQAGGPPGTPTGYWVGYQGDVEPVLREGFVRAVEVSLGIGSGEAADGGGRAEPWPVQLDWKCPNPYFEVWVTWRRHRGDPKGGPDEAEGQVNILIATPPDTSNRLTTRPLQPPAPPPGVPAEPILAPAEATASQGMWLIAHDHHVPHTVDRVVDVTAGEVVDALVDQPSALVGLPAGRWIIPSPSTFWEDRGPVVVVAPPSYAGGADPTRSTAP